MNMKSYLVPILGILILLGAGCKKEEIKPTSTSSDYLIFGHFYGFCQGERCVEIFKLDDTALQEDILDIYPDRTKFYIASYKSLAATKFEAVKDLRANFPTELLSEQDTVLGQPDASDGGGLYIEYKSGTVHKFWIIDQFKTNVPTKYHGFMDKVNEKIALLQ